MSFRWSYLDDPMPIAITDDGEITWWRRDQFETPGQVRQAMVREGMADTFTDVYVRKVYMARVTGPCGDMDWWQRVERNHVAAVPAWECG